MGEVFGAWGRIFAERREGLSDGEEAQGDQHGAEQEDEEYQHAARWTVADKPPADRAQRAGEQKRGEQQDMTRSDTAGS